MPPGNPGFKFLWSFFIFLRDPVRLAKSFLCLRPKGMVSLSTQRKETLVFLLKDGIENFNLGFSQNEICYL